MFFGRMICPAYSSRYVLVLSFAFYCAIACYCSSSNAVMIRADAFAFAPPLPQTNPRHAALSRSLYRKSKAKAAVVEFEFPSALQAQQPPGNGSSNDGETETNHGASTSTNTEGVPSSPLDRPVLSAIDATALFVFAGVGKASHSAVDGSLDLGAVLVTAFPFLLSWFLVAPLVGSYTPDATRDVKSAAVQTAKAWILAVPLGCVLRGVIKGYVPPVPFVVVTLIATLVILSLGRVGYTVLSELYVEMF